MAAKGEMSETDSKLKYVNMEDEEVKSLHNDEKERETCATMSEKRNDYNHKKKEKSGKQTVIMVKPKPLTKKQLQAAEHRRRKEMAEIGRQLLEQQKKQEVDKMSGEQKKEKDKEHKQTTVRDLQAEIEEQKAQSEMEQQKLEAKQRLLEAQEKKKEKRKKKKEMKHTKKLVQQEAKQRLEELHSRGISQRCFKETVSFEEEEKLSTLDDLEPLPPLEGTFRKKDHLWNLPPRLSALRTNQSNSQCNTGKDSKVQVSKGEEPSKIEQVEKRGHPKSDHQKTSHVLQRRPEKFEDKENMPSPLHETKLSPVCRQAPLIEHDRELTSHHLEQYRELMLVQPERQTQCQLRGKVSKVGLHKAEMLKRQQEREAQRNEEEMREILAVEKQKHSWLPALHPRCPLQPLGETKAAA
ncbi:trichohyalin-like [Liolophura sinensis]|uniref:trichohyalin-like n=1 Tax=Liolophura sinensis TaxID=3198878 RepID=UPI00315969D0